MGRISGIGQITPNTVKGHKTLSTTTTGSLDAKTYGLIVLAVAATTRCDGCVAVRTVEAIRHGATHGGTADALSAMISLNAEAALVYSACALDAVQACEKA